MMEAEEDVNIYSISRFFTLDRQFSEEDFAEGKKQMVAEAGKENKLETETYKNFHKTHVETIK